MSQLAYTGTPKVGRVGALAESAEGIHAIAKVASVAIPFGCFVTRNADDVKAKLPTSAAEVLNGAKASGGVAVSTNAIVSDPSVVNPLFPTNKEFAALRRGPIFVLVEEAVTQGDQAFVRFADAVASQDAGYLAASGGAANQKGAFRKSADASAATAQVATLTPTAVNATIYAVEVKGADGNVIAAAEYLSDGSATATEIVTGLKAALGTVAGIALSGTATLILTASVAGVGFSVVSIGDGTIAVAATQANVAGTASAVAVPGCYFKTSAAAGSLAVLGVELGGA